MPAAVADSVVELAWLLDVAGMAVAADTDVAGSPALHMQELVDLRVGHQKGVADRTHDPALDRAGSDVLAVALQQGPVLLRRVEQQVGS